ncbi:hypothetical protein [Streptomyces sp. BBFR102]|uniref:hypothetical protein n=1 Tax=Streptomyces sp. BBFR102 TaxID=3448171 RepID=UPI003F53D29B
MPDTADTAGDPGTAQAPTQAGTQAARLALAPVGDRQADWTLSGVGTLAEAGGAPHSRRPATG